MPSPTVVLIPTSTLEDFPTALSTDHARGLLAAVTVAYHPSLVAAAAAVPTFSRADSPVPPHTDDGPAGDYLCPSVCEPKLTDAMAHRITDAGGRVIRGDRRSDFQSALDLPAGQTSQTIAPEDFYAAGYVWLQITILTRRLRYTSNLDIADLQQKFVAAAQAYVGDRLDDANDSLHAVFDALAEERDHYFSSDPHLIDLTLCTAGTLDRLRDQLSDPNLGQTTSVLIDADCLKKLDDPSATETLKTLDAAWSGGDVSVIGGGPPADVSLSTMTLRGATDQLHQTRQRWSDVFYRSPSVYGRLSGGTPGDLIGAIAAMGYRGVVPIDFTSGRSIGGESKVRLSGSSGEIEALTATPIDADDDASFLSLGPTLGTAIDAGEIATALMVRWPGGGCDSFNDVIRASRWGGALGRLWPIEKYFTEGESPYHHGQLDVVDVDPDLQSYADQTGDPIGQSAGQFVDQVREQHDSVGRAILSLVHASIGSPQTASPDPTALSELAAAAVGAIPGGGTAAALLYNPLSAGRRVTTTITPAGGRPPSRSAVIYACSPPEASDQTSGAFSGKTSGKTSGKPVFDVTADVPAGGFVIVRGGDGSGAKSGSLLNRLLGKSGTDIVRTADGRTLENEFMEIALSPAGGIGGVYSGATRGNRLSARLVLATDGGGQSEMRPRSHDIIHRGPATAVVRETGGIHAAGMQSDQRVATYHMDYRLHRGERAIAISGQIELADSFVIDPAEASDPWRNYIAMRVAMPDSSATIRWGVRDKWHRCTARRVAAATGYLIDDIDRQTLLSTAGHAFHRRVGDRYIDTLLAIGRNRTARFNFNVVCDPPHAMAAATAAVTPPTIVPIEDHASLPESGYLCHVSGRDVVINHVEVNRDDRLTLQIELLATRAKSTTATLRFCRDIAVAMTGGTAGGTAAPQSLPHEGDTIKVPLSGHGRRTIEVTFQ